MRAALLVGLLGISGCNQIFGLKATTEQDAGPPSEVGLDATDFRTIRITKFVVDQTGVGTANKTTITLDQPLDADPHARVGLIDQPLEDAPYVDGAIKIPVTLPGNDWRLVATLDGMPHEYQWKVISAHITASVSDGHQAPPPIPSGSSYSMNLPNQTYKNFTFSTSGVWTELHRIASQGTPFSYVLGSSNQAEPALGPLGAPQSSQGDWQLFVEQATNAECHQSLGVAFQSADLVAGSATMTTPAWTTTTSIWPDPVIKGDGGVTNRFFVLGQRFTSDGATPYNLTEFGYVIGGGVPSFNRPKVANDADHIGTRRSLMVNLMDCRNGKPTGMPAYVDVPAFNDHTTTGERGMVKAIYLELSTSRNVSTTGSQLISSLQGISLTNTVTLEAPLAKDLAFDGLTLEQAGAVVGEKPDFKQTISVAAARQIPLTWTYELGVADVKPAPDDVTVILYNVASAIEKTPVRIYHVTSPKVVVDSSVFDSTKYPVRNFVFEVIARVGAPNAATGDYTKLQYPMSSASAYSYAFKVAP